MWSAIQWLVVRIAAIRWFMKMGWLGLLIPIVLLLKSIGLPVLAVLSIIAIPVIILLLLFGLPIFLVMIFGSLLMGFLGFLLTAGVVAIKVALFVVLPAWLLWKLFGLIFRRGKDNGGEDSGPASDYPTDSTGGTTSGPSGDATDGL